MSQNTIPVVDLSDFRSGDSSKRDAFVRGVGDALRQVGFFALTGHGIEDALIRKAYALIGDLFRLPEATKKRYEKIEHKGQRGFTSFGREHAKDSPAPDLKEFWHVGREDFTNKTLAATYMKNVWPSEVAGFSETMQRLYGSLDQCALTLLEACSLYIGEEESRLRDIAVDGNSILRLINYPPLPPDRDPGSVRAGAHEDINLITLLIDATTSGLEILDRSGEWVPVVTPRGCIIVDAGDMLQNITNGYYRSTTHRVVNPKDSNEQRFSMPFFAHARGEVSLKPLESCVNEMGGVVQYPTITADQYLHQRLAEIGLG